VPVVLEDDPAEGVPVGLVEADRRVYPLDWWKPTENRAGTPYLQGMIFDYEYTTIYQKEVAGYTRRGSS